MPTPPSPCTYVRMWYICLSIWLGTTDPNPLPPCTYVPYNSLGTWVSEYFWMVSIWVSQNSWIVSTWVSKYSRIVLIALPLPHARPLTAPRIVSTSDSEYLFLPSLESTYCPVSTAVPLYQARLVCMYEHKTHTHTHTHTHTPCMNTYCTYV